MSAIKVAFHVESYWPNELSILHTAQIKLYYSFSKTA